MPFFLIPLSLHSSSLQSCVLRLRSRYFLIVKLFSGLEQREDFLSLRFFLILMNSPSQTPSLPLTRSTFLSFPPSLHPSVFEKQIIGRGDGLFSCSVSDCGCSLLHTQLHTSARSSGCVDTNLFCLCENENRGRNLKCRRTQCVSS